MATLPLIVPPAQPAFNSPNDNGNPNNSVSVTVSPPPTLFPQNEPGKMMPVIDQPPLIVELFTDKKAPKPPPFTVRPPFTITFSSSQESPGFTTTPPLSVVFVKTPLHSVSAPAGAAEAAIAAISAAPASAAINVLGMFPPFPTRNQVESGLPACQISYIPGAPSNDVASLTHHLHRPVIRRGTVRRLGLRACGGRAFLPQPVADARLRDADGRGRFRPGQTGADEGQCALA